MYYTYTNMSRPVEYEVRTENPESTEELAELIGVQLQGGEIIELIGDVGAGKTTFVRGLARGAGSSARVSSPTFTVSKVYDSDNIRLHHYDFYRLNDFKIIQNELAEVLEDPKSSAVLEWAGKVQNVLPAGRIRIKIEVESEKGRIMKFFIPEDYPHIRIEQ